MFPKEITTMKPQGSFGRHTGLSCIQKILNKQMISFFRRMISFLVFTDKKQVTELFNEHFVHIADGVGEIADHQYGEGFCDLPSIKVIQANIGTKGEEDCLSLQLTNATQIEELLSNVNTRKACGHDMLPPRLIKESSRAIAGPVAKILNTSIAHSRYPSRWKMGQVTPLFMMELDKRNYRPVTVLPCLTQYF